MLQINKIPIYVQYNLTKFTYLHKNAIKQLKRQLQQFHPEL